MITVSENWKKVIKPFLKEKNFSFVNSKRVGKSLILTYKKGDLLAIFEFYGDEISIELTEGEDRQLILEELEIILG